MAEPLRTEIPACPAILVVGSGTAGVSAALEAANLGHPVILVEGGPRPDEALLGKVRDSSGIERLAAASVVEVEGRVGRFRVSIQAGSSPAVDREAGAIVVATGTTHAPPDPVSGVTDLSSIEAAISGSAGHPIPASVGFLAYAREIGDRAAIRAIGAACEAREKHGKDAYVFTDDVTVVGPAGQALYERALQAGVIFFRSVAVAVEKVEDGAIVRGEDMILGRPFEIRCGAVASPGALVPSPGTLSMSSILGIGMEDGRHLGPGNVTFHPSGTQRVGVFVAGSCAGDASPEAAAMSGRIAARKANGLIAGGRMSVVPGDVAISQKACAACLTCLRLCPWGAIEVIPGRRTPLISDTDCHDCGLCAASCPMRAIAVEAMPDDSIVTSGLAALPRAALPSRAVVALACDRSGWAAAALARELGVDLPSSAGIVRVPCAGMVGTNAILSLLASGAGAVLLLGCPEDNCANRRGSIAAARRVQWVRDLLSAIGDDPERARFRAVASNMPHALAAELRAASTPKGA